MALSNRPVFVQTPKSATALIATANTNRDGSGTLETLLTAGANGALVTSIVALRQNTIAASVVTLFVSLDGGSTKRLLDEAAMAAYTVSNTAAQTKVTLVDKTNPDAAIRLPASAILYCAATVIPASLGVHVFAEYMDY